MPSQVSLMEYRALADMRFLIRRYLNGTERAVRAVGLEPQQYMAMLQLRGLPPSELPTIRALSDRMQLRHHSMGELINRMEKRGLFQRERAQNDRRCVLVRMTPQAERLLDRVVRHRIAELRVTGRDLVRSLSVVVGTRARPKRSPRRPQRVARNSSRRQAKK